MLSSKNLLGTVGISCALLLATGCRISLVEDDDDDNDIGGGRTTTGGTTSTGGVGNTVTGGAAGSSGEGGTGTGGTAGSTGEGGSSTGGSTYFSLSSVTINGSRRSGELALSGQLGIAEGEIAFVLSSIKNPENVNEAVDPTKVSFQVTLDGEAMECEVGPTGELQQAPVDVVFINDTTGSMSGTVNGISASIREFAAAITAKGIDARFAMVTYGDEFSTFQAGESAFTVGKAEFAGSETDGASRPYVDLTDLETFETFLTEVKDSGDLGVDGEDSPENTLGALHYAIDTMDWRTGAARVFIAIGDDAAHTPTTVASLSYLAAHFGPPQVGDLLASLDGTAVVHVVGNDVGSDPYYNIRGLAEATGGVFIDLPSDGVVDLSAMELNAWVGSTYFGVCFGAQPGDREMVVNATFTGASEHRGAVTFDITLI